jgi:hypothetical protein
MSNTGALVYTRAATAEKNANSGAFARLCAPSSPLPSPDACPNGPRNEVRRTVTVASMTTSVEMVMRGLTGLCAVSRARCSGDLCDVAWQAVRRFKK